MNLGQDSVVYVAFWNGYDEREVTGVYLALEAAKASVTVEVLEWTEYAADDDDPRMWTSPGGERSIEEWVVQ